MANGKAYRNEYVMFTASATVVLEHVEYLNRWHHAAMGIVPRSDLHLAAQLDTRCRQRKNSIALAALRSIQANSFSRHIAMPAWPRRSASGAREEAVFIISNGSPHMVTPSAPRARLFPQEAIAQRQA